MVKRIHGRYQGRCSAVVHDGLVYAVATDPENAATIEEQTRNTLAALEKYLTEAGSGKTGLLQATIYLTDMRNKKAMDAIWCDWIGDKENWPQRACVGADLEPTDLIEVVVTARVL
jgi:enamine deaminase RidA (YjgF/YER057c/UK114 family)